MSTYYVLKRGETYWSYSDGNRKNYWATDLVYVNMFTSILRAAASCGPNDIIVRLDIKETQVVIREEEVK